MSKHLPTIRVVLVYITRYVLYVLYRACEANEALYTAFNLQSLFDVRDRILNTSEVSLPLSVAALKTSLCVCVCVCGLQIFDDLQQQIDDTINSFNYTSDSFLDNATQTALNDFTSASVDSINITGNRMLLTHTHTHARTHTLYTHKCIHYTH